MMQSQDCKKNGVCSNSAHYVGPTGKSTSEPIRNSVVDMQIILHSPQLPTALRSLTADHVGRLLKISGIIVSASKVKPKSTQVVMKCTRCGKYTKIENANLNSSIPQRCEGSNEAGIDCGPTPFVICPDDCMYVDQQSLKLQELPDAVPAGEMPRSMLLIVERGLVDMFHQVREYQYWVYYRCSPNEQTIFRNLKRL